MSRLNPDQFHEARFQILSDELSSIKSEVWLIARYLERASGRTPDLGAKGDLLEAQDRLEKLLGVLPRSANSDVLGPATDPLE